MMEVEVKETDTKIINVKLNPAKAGRKWGWYDLVLFFFGFDLNFGT
ncbi:MAG: hypothetical protein IPO63_11955 [Bacteroidetes bacterium]|nr:hypothetical protein [Bacteroidota bacterium]